MLYKLNNWRRLLLAVIDAVIINGVIITALWLRFEGNVPVQWWGLYLHTTGWITPLMMIVCYAFGLYNRVWEYASTGAALVIVLSISTGIGLAFLVMLFHPRLMYPRSVLVMTWGMSILAIGGMRFGWRELRRRVFIAHQCPAHIERRRALIYGAGDAGTMLARHIEIDPSAPYTVVGFVDDDPALARMIVAGHRVLGTGEQLSQLVPRHNIAEVIAAMPSTSGDQIRRITRLCQDAGVRVSTVPRLLELVNGQVDVRRVRGIRYEDLLGRDVVDLGLEVEHDYISGRTILVTGAGGSIGSEICRQLCRYRPAKILLLGRGENRIHEVYGELREKFDHIRFVPVICNFTVREALEEVFRTYRPEIVFHAGAHKHVYLMELYPVEAIRNNVLGTAITADLADAYEVRRFISISTDKAVDPCNVMGATKRLCELLIAQRNGASATKFMNVRFGNVIGSSGSVLTIFERQLREGQPLTVSDPRATRYFMTVAEAAFLVLEAGALGEGGETFVLDMAEPIPILQIAREFLQMHGKDPDAPGAIEFTSLRPGEKLHESLISADEELVPTSCKRIMRVVGSSEAAFQLSSYELMEQVKAALASNDVEPILCAVKSATKASVLGRTSGTESG